MYIAKIIISIQFQLLQKNKINRFTLLAYFYFANSSIITIEHHVCYFVFSLHGNNLFFRIEKKMIIYFYTYNKRPEVVALTSAAPDVEEASIAPHQEQHDASTMQMRGQSR